METPYSIREYESELLKALLANTRPKPTKPKR